MICSHIVYNPGKYSIVSSITLILRENQGNTQIGIFEVKCGIKFEMTYATRILLGFMESAPKFHSIICLQQIIIDVWCSQWRLGLARSAVPTQGITVDKKCKISILASLLQLIFYSSV